MWLITLLAPSTLGGTKVHTPAEGAVIVSDEVKADLEAEGLLDTADEVDDDGVVTVFDEPEAAAEVKAKRG